MDNNNNIRDADFTDLENTSDEDGSEYLDGTDDEEDERDGDDDKRFTLNVDTLTGSHFQVFAYPSDTVDVVKARIAFQEGIGPYDQHIIWNNVELLDEKILSDIGLCDGCTVKLVLALKGGPLDTAQSKSYIGNYIEEMISSLDNLFLNSTLRPLSPLATEKSSVKLPRLKKQKTSCVTTTEQRLLEELGEISTDSDTDENENIPENCLRDSKSKFVILEEQGRIFLIRLRRVERDTTASGDTSQCSNSTVSADKNVGIGSMDENIRFLRRASETFGNAGDKSVIGSGTRFSSRYGRIRDKGIPNNNASNTHTTVNERIQENAATMEKVNLLKKRMLSARKKRKLRLTGVGSHSGKAKNSETGVLNENVSSCANSSKSSESIRLPQLKRDPSNANKTLKSGRAVSFGYGTTIRKVPTQSNLSSINAKSRQSTAVPITGGSNTCRNPSLVQRSNLSTATAKSDRKSSRLSTPINKPSQLPSVPLETHLYNLNRVIADIFMQNRRTSAWKQSVGTPPYTASQLAQYVRAKVNVLLCQQEQFYKTFPTVNEYRKTVGRNINGKSPLRNNLLIPTVIFHRLFESDTMDSVENKEKTPSSISGRVTARMKIKSVRTITADTTIILPLIELNKNQSRPSTNSNGLRTKSGRSRPKTGNNQSIKKAAKNHIRCAHLECKKKLGLATTYKCRCGLAFCPTHRYPESHNCSFDFKEEGRRIISHDNPLIGPKKIDEI